MDEEEGQFYIDPEQNQVREVIPIEQANPIYSKTIVQQPTTVCLKMVEIPRQADPTFYKPFKIEASKSEDEFEERNDGEFTFVSPFTEFYFREQLVYQRYSNQKFNRYKEMAYFPGTFLPKNLFSDYLKQDSYSLRPILRECYDQGQPALPQLASTELLFDSDFESGNLFAVFKVSDREYDLVMQNDNNSVGNNQWFYFSVEKLVPGAEYTFNVVNFTKSDSLFNYGMSPVFYSTALNKKNGTQWFKAGKQVSYKKNALPRQNCRRFYYKLSFKVNWKIANDKVYIAYTYPYTYSKIKHRLDALVIKHADIVTKVQIGKTLAKKSIQALIIGNKSKTKKDTRKAIIIMARQHPGQTQGSFVCDGVIDRLLTKDSKQAEFIRKNYVVYVIPMVNPDGVIFGHYRTNLAGKDLNRKWDSTDKEMGCPEVVAIKNWLQQISRQREIRFILDLHGHSKKLNSFFYGNPCPQNPEQVRIYPYLCSQFHPAVQFLDCTFATQQYKRKAARVYLSFVYKQLQVFTYEVSFYAYIKQSKKEQFTPSQFEALGHNLVNSLYVYLDSEVKAQTKSNFKDNLLMKYLAELKQNKKLLDIGVENQSGSESKPEEGEVNLLELPDNVALNKKSQVSVSQQKQGKVLPKKPSSKKSSRQIKQARQMSKPVRNIKFLEISRVNSILPDRYQLGLQPIRKKEYEPQIIRNQSMVMKVSSICQTENSDALFQLYKPEQIQDSGNLSNSIKTEARNSSDKRYSSLIKNTKNNNNIIFRIDFNNERASSTVNSREKRVLYHAFSQTLITFKTAPADRMKSSQLFPLVDSPDTQRRSRKNAIKYQTMRISLKKQTQIFLNGMVKKFLIEKEQRSQQPSMGDRPLSIKRKQIYRK